MGLFEGAKEILVVTADPNSDGLRRADRTHQRICHCAVYIHAFLKRVPELFERRNAA